MTDRLQVPSACFGELAQVNQRIRAIVKQATSPEQVVSAMDALGYSAD